MKIEDIKIEDTADANYVIKKFFNNNLNNIKIAQLEQLVLTVYSMGKNNGASNDCAPCDIKVESTGEVSAKVNPFEINDRAKVLEDVEIGHSGILMKTNNVGTVNSINGDTVTVLFESVEDGELIEVNVLFDKLEKVS